MVEQIAVTIASRLILGAVFVFFSSGLSDAPRGAGKQLDVVMSDYRSPRDAYFRPFIWGFVIGAIGRLVTGSVMYDPTSKRE